MHPVTIQKFSDRLTRLHGVLSVDFGDGAFWVNVETMDSLSCEDVFGSVKVATNMKTTIHRFPVYKVRRHDTSTVTALENALAVEIAKRPFESRQRAP